MGKLLKFLVWVLAICGVVIGVARAVAIRWWRVPANDPGVAPRRATWPPGTGPSPTTTSSPVAGGERPRIVSVSVLRAEGCEVAGETRTVDFQLSAENATSYRASSRSGSTSGTVSAGAADVSLLMRCTGASDTFTFVVTDADGRSSDAYRKAVNTGLRGGRTSPAGP